MLHLVLKMWLLIYMRVKQMKDGSGFLEGLKKVGKVLAPVGEALKPVGKEIGKEAISILGDLAKEKAKEKMASKPATTTKGSGIYSAGVNLSPAQSRSLRSGRGITVKPAMLDEAGRYVMSLSDEMAKKMMKAFQSNKGVKMTKEMFEDLVDRKSGGSMWGAVGRVLGPIIVDKLIDVGVSAAQKKLEGSGRGPRVFKKGQLRTMDHVQGDRTEGDGFLDNFVKQVSQYRPSDIQKIKPGKALQDLQSGKLHGEIFKITNPIMREQSGAPSPYQVKGSGIYSAGAGVFSAGVRGGDMMPIQTGTPYLLQSSPASDPFVPSQLLTVSQSSTGGARKKRVRV